MEIQFYKYQATGNDFILIDNRDTSFTKYLRLIPQLCDRKFGIGSDGLILIESHAEADFEMIFYNPDGSQSLCGNGSRCALRFAQFLGIITERASFMAYDGLHQAEILGEDIRLRMADVERVTPLSEGDMFLDTGSPHLVRFVKDISSYPVVEEGRKLRNHDINGSRGVNVNFVEIKDNEGISVRTYERGVENETLSCGTGVTAAALASSLKHVKSPAHIQTKGGRLQVSFIQKNDGTYGDIHLIGPAEAVFTGKIDLEKIRVRKENPQKV